MNRTFRRSHGLSLIEVLISIFVLAVGLLGVASLLPVGQRQVQRGAAYMRATDLSTKAFGMIEAHGMNNPARLLNPVTGAMDDAVNPFDGSRLALKLDSGVVPTTTSFTIDPDPDRLQYVDNDAAHDLDGAYLHFVRGGLRGSRRRIASYAYNAAGTPITLASSLAVAPSTANSVAVIYRQQAFALDPHYASVHGAGTDPFAVGMRRLTLLGAVGVGTFSRMNAAQVGELFVSTDEEVYDIPSDPTLNPRQLYITEPYDDANGNGSFDAGETYTDVDSSGFWEGDPEPYIDANNNGRFDTGETYTDVNGSGSWDPGIKRQSQGNFSWAATFVPGDGGMQNRDYIVSVLVFYKRNINVQASNGGGGFIQWNVDLSFLNTTNLGGGDATLSSPDASQIVVDTNANGTLDAGERTHFRPQQWLLVANRRRTGASPFPGVAIPSADAEQLDRAVYRWYRIAAVREPYDNGGVAAVDVRLVGSDWDTSRVISLPDNGSDPSKYMATAYEGLMGVFQRRMELEEIPIGSTE